MRWFIALIALAAVIAAIAFFSSQQLAGNPSVSSETSDSSENDEGQTPDQNTQPEEAEPVPDPVIETAPTAEPEAEPQPEPAPAPDVAATVPSSEPDGYRITSSFTGMASWYGNELAGNQTASGEIFDPSQLTAAHLTLPFDTRVRVTRLSNGSSVIVRINDRGPYAHGRIIDLSRAAAEVLGMVQDGEAEVRVDVLEGR